MGLGQILRAGGTVRPTQIHAAVTPAIGHDPETERLRGEVTELLQQVSDGRPAAAELLMPLIYDELRRIARGFMRRERTDHTLEPTALVHEAYMRMLGQDRVSWQSRGHFFSMAATMMRRVLVDSSRHHLRVKRGAGAEHQELLEGEMMVAGAALSAVDLLALNEALERLARRDRRMVQVVELRFFAGLDVSETAEVLGVSAPTVKRDWSVARAWLARDLGGSATENL
jgi:RNA polymerase sigma factor (TIGR02999 family)